MGIRCIKFGAGLPFNLLRRSSPLSLRKVSTMAGLAVFPLSNSSSLKIQKGDITEWSVDGASDAIVSPLSFFLPFFFWNSVLDRIPLAFLVSIVILL